MNPLLAQLLTWFLGELGKFVIAFVENLAKGEAPLAALADAAAMIVKSFTSATELTAAERHMGAVNALAAWHGDCGYAVPEDALLHTTICLAEVKQQADTAV